MAVNKKPNYQALADANARAAAFVQTAVTAIKAAKPKTIDRTSPPLRDVIEELSQLTQKLDEHDNYIGVKLQEIEERIRAWQPEDQRHVDVLFPPWGKLSWSAKRGYWRLIVLDLELAEATELKEMSRECRSDAFKVLPELLKRLGIIK
jgi:hypothetical protein